MQTEYKKIKNLFLRQSYLDSWDDYERSLRKKSFVKWDYVILTASNEEQAMAYKEQIAIRLKHNLLPKETHFEVLPDPGGKRVGSGGATFNVLKYIADQDGNTSINHFENKRILVIHSGGDSKRIPQYSACGKLFSPVPRELPNGQSSTLFDEFIISMSGIPSRIKEGMLVLSGDVLLLFNPLQMDFQFKGAAAISIKEHVNTGKNHGVYLNDGKDYVDMFLHKQSEEHLRELGAVDEQDFVDLDTGAVMMDNDLLNALFSLISTDNQVDPVKFDEFVNENARISFYGDFLYPLATKSTLDQYYKEAPDGSFCLELLNCRTKLWETLHSFSMKLLCLSPAEFIHFGTTKELLDLVTTNIYDYEYLDWKKCVTTNISNNDFYAAHNSFIEDSVSVEEGSYIENSYLLGTTKVASNSVVSSMILDNATIPEGVVVHGLKLKNGMYTVRIYGVNDNPKKTYQDNGDFLAGNLQDFITGNELELSDVWSGHEYYLWFASLYPVCKTLKEGLTFAQILYRMSQNTATKEDIALWKSKERMSLYSSFNEADVKEIVPWTKELENRILVDKFIHCLENRIYYEEALKIFGQFGINEQQFKLIMEAADQADFSLTIRIYYALSRFMKKKDIQLLDFSYDKVESLCFDTIQKAIYENGVQNIKNSSQYKIAKEQVDIHLPVRVNWGGGWSDTPPHCNEHGGVVLNAAIKLNGILPVQITVKRLTKLHVEFESQDVGVFGIVDNAKDIQECHNPFDPFALHKAALIACGIIPVTGECDLKEILENLGGGIYLSTQVIGIPKGSGLGTSSILSGACVKGIFEFLGQKLNDNELFDIVLSMEQIMSTGGGWQDQVGGITPGIKYITTTPGIGQDIHVEYVHLHDSTKKELQERLALIYTGQRRLARNLLREVVGGYIGGRPESIYALHEIQRIAVLMKFELERGDIDEFAKLLNEHWELSKMLDMGSTNTCIDQIFLSCEDLIDGKFISGAGGGGFLQVILKKGVTKDQLRKRLKGVFQNSGVDVWDCEVLFDYE